MCADVVLCLQYVYYNTIRHRRQRALRNLRYRSLRPIDVSLQHCFPDSGIKRREFGLTIKSQSTRLGAEALKCKDGKFKNRMLKEKLSYIEDNFAEMNFMAIEYKIIIGRLYPYIECMP